MPMRTNRCRKQKKSTWYLVPTLSALTFLPFNAMGESINDIKQALEAATGQLQKENQLLQQYKTEAEAARLACESARDSYGYENAQLENYQNSVGTASTLAQKKITLEGDQYLIETILSGSATKVQRMQYYNKFGDADPSATLSKIKSDLATIGTYLDKINNLSAEREKALQKTHLPCGKTFPEKSSLVADQGMTVRGQGLKVTELESKLKTLEEQSKAKAEKEASDAKAAEEKRIAEQNDLAAKAKQAAEDKTAADKKASIAKNPCQSPATTEISSAKNSYTIQTRRCQAAQLTFNSSSQKYNAASAAQRKKLLKTFNEHKARSQKECGLKNTARQAHNRNIDSALRDFKTNCNSIYLPAGSGSMTQQAKSNSCYQRCAKSYKKL